MKISHLNQHPLSLISKTKEQKNIDKVSFKEILEHEHSSIKVSKHAKQRMADRGIVIGENQWNIIDKKMKEARQKGVNDSLIIMDQAALIVNVKNSTVITALDKEEAVAQIFTNINGTIIIN